MYNVVQLSQTYVLRMGLAVIRKENDWVPLPGGETPTVGKTGLKTTLQTIHRQTVALKQLKFQQISSSKKLQIAQLCNMMLS